MPKTVRIEGPQDRWEIVDFEHNRAQRKHHKNQHLPNVLSLLNLRQAPNYPAEPAKHACEDVNFHVVGIIESIVAEVSKVVEEEENTQQGYKAGQLFRFAVDRSKCEIVFVSSSLFLR